MKSYTFTAPVEPVPYSIATNRNGRVIKPAKLREFQGAVLAACFGKIPKRWEGPIGIDLVEVFTRPKYLCKPTVPDGFMPHTTKPDRDNICKAVQDAILGAEAKKFFDYPDDCYVVNGETAKLYAPKGVRGFIWVRLFEPEPANQLWQRITGIPVATIAKQGALI